ncbi:hypothetical protein V1592_18620 [Enterobacter hormaechei subsp. xiangfangensis]|uniref:hypothetical protein n=1 Tax=Enterobacter hormaechei TaxID=158836 RepID=UPI0037542CDF
MITLTKEWLLKTIAELEEDRDAVPGVVSEDAAMALAAMKLALASLEAKSKLSNFIATQESLGVSFERVLAENIEELFVPSKSTPPAPVAVPEWTNEQCLEFMSIAFRHAEIKGDLELHDIRLGVRMVNGSRAAVLQGADGNSPVIPDGWVMVPVDATRAMIDAARRVEEDGYDAMHKAMIAAAPQQEVNNG